jgi:lysophospholipase L1-like esterase
MEAAMKPVRQALLALFAFGFALAAQADALFVAGAVPVSSGDEAAIERLESLGMTVTVVKDSASSSGSANGKELVVISDSVSPGKVSSKFRNVAVPVLVFRPQLYDNMGMTDADSGTDFGVSGSQTQLRMSGTHPLTAGLTGVVTVENSPAKFSWGSPAASAIAYEAGDTMASGSAAPARRVALYLNAGALDAWNVNGRDLFDAAVQWARDDAPPGGGGTVHLFPLGDSITHGKAQHWTYRRDLEAALLDAGCDFDFVGTQRSPWQGPGEPLDDNHNEGHSGYRTDEIDAELPGWLPGNAHDWALIHLGTNDVLQHTSLSAARTHLSNIIDQLRDRNSHVGILLAQIIPNRPENEADVVDLNDRIASLAQDKSTAASPVIVVNQYSGFDAASQTYDGIHPNNSGEAFMAERWAEALLPQIANSCN